MATAADSSFGFDSNGVFVHPTVGRFMELTPEGRLAFVSEFFEDKVWRRVLNDDIRDKFVDLYATFLLKRDLSGRSGPDAVEPPGFVTVFFEDLLTERVSSRTTLNGTGGPTPPAQPQENEMLIDPFSFVIAPPPIAHQQNLEFAPPEEQEADLRLLDAALSVKAEAVSPAVPQKVKAAAQKKKVKRTKIAAKAMPRKYADVGMCHLCNKTTRKDRQHVLGRHWTTGLFRCSVPGCSQETKFKQSIESHINSVHKGQGHYENRTDEFREDLFALTRQCFPQSRPRVRRSL